MGLTIDYRIRLKGASQVQPFLTVALAEAKGRGWKVRRRKSADLRAILVPHPRCEDIDLNFADGPVAEGFVKTSSAPLEVHVEIVKFFDALKPHCASIKLDDETGYAKHRDLKKLRSARESFDSAFQGLNLTNSGPAIFTGLIISSDGSTQITEEMRGRLSKAEVMKLEKSLRSVTKSVR